MNQPSVCGHTDLEGHACTRQGGHDGLHAMYVHTESGEGVCISAYQWDDGGNMALVAQERGNAIEADYYTADREALVAEVIAQAREALPAGSVFEVRSKIPPTDGIKWYYGRKQPTLAEQANKWSVVWYWNFDMIPPLPLFQVPIDEAAMDPRTGYCTVARLEA
jgi:hypothetical protein